MKKNMLCSVLLSAIFCINCGKGSPTAPSEASQVTSSSEGLLTFSFDDNRLCAFNTAVSVLDKAGYKATEYVITGKMSGSDDYMSSRDVLDMQSRGHEIGSHTRTHRDLTTISQSEWQSEIVGAKDDLHAMGIRNVITFAYPFGGVNQSVESFVRNAGYSGARSTINGIVTGSSDPFSLPRQNLGGNVAISDVKKWMDDAKQNKTWLILLAHHVDHSPNDYSITPELFSEIVNYAKTSSLRVVTISEGLRIKGM